MFKFPININENKVAYVLFSILPISIIAGSAVLNILILFIDLYFIFVIIKKKEAKILLNKIFILFILLWILLMLNSILIAKQHFFYQNNFIEKKTLKQRYKKQSNRHQSQNIATCLQQADWTSR